MLRSIKDIHETLVSCELNRTDNVMLHADAGVAAQLQVSDVNDKLDFLISILMDFFDKGNIIVPTFTYSATKGEVFIPDVTESDVGLFSETFRKKSGVLRSTHPIFSVACFGQDAPYFIKASNEKCFGTETFFEKLITRNVKIICLGAHLIELHSFIILNRYMKFHIGSLNTFLFASLKRTIRSKAMLNILLEI